jgi:hypothetical protein
MFLESNHPKEGAACSPSMATIIIFLTISLVHGGLVMLSWYDCARGIRGVALLVLRTSVAAHILIEAQRQHLFAEPSVVTILLGTLGVGLSLGILTAVCGLAAILGGISLLLTGHIGASECGIVTLFLCAAVSILGPGVYSLDWILFGRRRVIL